MIFHCGGPQATKEKWSFEGQSIVIFNRFKYLGVLLTPPNSFNRHLTERISYPNAALNRVWSEFLITNLVPLSFKFQVFYLISKLAVCYATQIRGYDN